MPDQKPLKDRVKEWMVKTGYPLEMIVAKEFRDVGFSSQPTQYVEDIETKKLREIDLHASLCHWTPKYRIIFSCVVECKGEVNDAAWVMFSTGTRLPEGWLLLHTITSSLGRKIVDKASDIPELMKLPFFQSSGHTAYGMVRALTNSGGSDDYRDNCFKAVQQVSNAILSLASAYSRNQGEPTFFVGRPVIVTSAPLFEARLGEAGELVLEERAQGLLSWRGSQASEMLIDVVTKPALPGFVAAAKNAYELLQCQCQPWIESSLEQFHRDNTPITIIGG